MESSRDRHEQSKIPEIKFEISDLLAIEKLVQNREREQLVLDELSLPLPIERLQITIDGPPRNQTSYAFNTAIYLRDTEETDRRAEEFFDLFVHRNDAESVTENDLTHYFSSHTGYNYLITMSEECDSIHLISAGVGDTGAELGKRVLENFQFGEDDVDDALDNHLFMSTQLLQELYSFYEMNNVALHLELRPAEILGEIPILPELQKAPLQPPERKVYLRDLGGMESVKEELMDVVMQIQHPEIMSAWNAERPNGIFLYGPPGTGKTTLAEALANEINATLDTVKSSEIYRKWMGESESNFQAIIEEALASRAPRVLLFDEIDGIIQKSGGSAYNTVATLFKQGIGTISRQNPNVIVMATSNKTPDEIDPAFFRKGRFDAHIYVPLPDHDGRKAIFGTLVERYTLSLTTERMVFDYASLDYQALAQATEDFNGADITEVVRKTVAAKAIQEIRTKEERRPITTNELLATIGRLRVSKP